MKKLYFILLFLLPFMTSCSPIINVDIMNYGNQEHIEKRENNKTKKGLGNNITIFPISYNKHVPEDIREELYKLFSEKISKNNFYDGLQNKDEIKNKFFQNGSFQRSAEIYLDTFINVSVSDRDLSLKIGNFLNTENFAILQIDQWPCAECLVTDTLKIKLRIIDSFSGKILWYGSDEVYDLNVQKEPENKEFALNMISRITDSFYHQFKLKWQKKRFNQLKETGLW